MMRIFLITILSLYISPIIAQKLNAEVSESIIMIGQPISLTYSVQLNKSDSIFFSPQSSEITALVASESGSLTSTKIKFEIINEFRDSFIVEKKTKMWIGQYVVTAWDSGVYVIPGPKISINDSTYVFDNIAVSCQLIDPIDGIDIYDIKERFADVPDKPFSLLSFLKNNWWWFSLALITIGIFIYFIKKKNIEPEKNSRPVSLKERTLIAINALESAKLWEKDQLKTHFVELSFILRSYLTSRYNISLLEKTSYETKILLTKKGLNEDTVEVIARILSQSDMVKFAKSKPDVVVILRVSTLAKQIIAETSPLEFDNVE